MKRRKLSRRISIHAPAWGATLNEQEESVQDINFNPRSRMGSDSAITARGWDTEYFNPRSRMGSDWAFIRDSVKIPLFQSTLPHGERPRNTSTRRISCTFQSTLPHGERQQKHEISSLFL